MYFCSCTKYDFEQVGDFASKIQRISLLIAYQKTAAVRVLRFAKAKAKGNFTGENITDADVRRKSIWISVRETDRPLSISESAVSDISHRKLCHAFCITSPTRR